MSSIQKLISVSAVVESLQFDYNQYLIGLLTYPGRRVSMSTEFNHYPVMNALVTEVMTNGADEENAADNVVKSITEQGVDISYASQMAKSGLKQLVASIGTTLPDVTFAMLVDGEMTLCNWGDLHVTYNT
jgi:hypothetical protein